MQKRTVDILGSADQIAQKIEGWNHTFQMAKPYIKGNMQETINQKINSK